MFTGKLPSATLSAYAATKFALDGYFSSVREEFRYTHCNITITLCILGAIGNYRQNLFVFLYSKLFLSPSSHAFYLFLLVVCKYTRPGMFI